VSLSLYGRVSAVAYGINPCPMLGECTPVRVNGNDGDIPPLSSANISLFGPGTFLVPLVHVSFGSEGAELRSMPSVGMPARRTHLDTEVPLPRSELHDGLG
jgi:hypothetical protein